MSAGRDSALAFIFPGQGSQTVGMGAELAREFPICRRTFEEADDALGFALSKLCFEGPDADLTLTANTQPAILTVSVAAWRLVDGAGLRPAFAAGHSLGEYSALVCAGVLTFGDAIRAVRLRGQAMQEAVPAGEGAMAAILGLSPEDVGRICEDSSQGEIVSPANYNSPEQTVIAGTAGAVRRACDTASACGAKRAIPLSVSAPFHCALMRPAEERLARHLAGIDFREPALTVVANATASPVTSGPAARETLVRQVCSPVRWTESMRALRGLGAARFVEIGPGRVLAGLMKRIDRAADVAGVEDRKTLESAIGVLGAGTEVLQGVRAAATGAEGRA